MMITQATDKAALTTSLSLHISLSTAIISGSQLYYGKKVLKFKLEK